MDLIGLSYVCCLRLLKKNSWKSKFNWFYYPGQVTHLWVSDFKRKSYFLLNESNVCPAQQVLVLMSVIHNVAVPNSLIVGAPRKNSSRKMYLPDDISHIVAWDQNNFYIPCALINIGGLVETRSGDSWRISACPKTNINKTFVGNWN